ncbi:MAG: methionyl-tRNA formyltransferase, partial [Campylobacterales bacterium]
LVYRTYQGLTPWPGIATANGLKLKEISLDATTGSYRHGEILEIAKERIRVGCGTGSLWIERVQPSGKSQMTASSYLHGKRLSVGDLLV